MIRHERAGIPVGAWGQRSKSRPQERQERVIRRSCSPRRLICNTLITGPQKGLS
nr:MAG TPA: hypothetical protein [Caudoviricetes sp.]